MVIVASALASASGIGKKSSSNQHRYSPEEYASLKNYFRSQFDAEPWSNTDAFEDLVQNFENDPQKYLISEGNIDTWTPVIKGYGDTFTQMFRNYAGRDPNEDEYNTFFSTVVTPNWIKPIESTELRQQTQSIMDQFFGRTVEEEARINADAEAQAALAPGSAFDEWQQSQLGAVSDVESSLLDYQTKLFEKIRPNLMTSLQSQGLLNTGGLNTALAGVQGDLANESSRYVAGARSAAQADIANRRYQIAASPSNYALQTEFGRAPNLTASGQAAL